MAGREDKTQEVVADVITERPVLPPNAVCILPLRPRLIESYASTGGQSLLVKEFTYILNEPYS
jgi:hypothetical protein